MLFDSLSKRTSTSTLRPVCERNTTACWVHLDYPSLKFRRHKLIDFMPDLTNKSGSPHRNPLEKLCT